MIRKRRRKVVCNKARNEEDCVFIKKGKMGRGGGCDKERKKKGKGELKGSVIRENKCWDKDNERKMKIGVGY